jgi:PAS domain-containing protein
MDETSKYLLEFSITLALVVLLAALSYLWLRGRKELGHLRQFFDQRPDPILRVDLISFEPLICNRAFSSLLGYADNLECVSQFSRYPHLPQQNFYQIYRLSQDSAASQAAKTGTHILFQDRRGNRIDYRQLVVQLDSTNRYMDIVLEQFGSNPPRLEPDYNLSIARKRDETPSEEILSNPNEMTNSFLDSPASKLLDKGYGFLGVEPPHRTDCSQ